MLIQTFKALYNIHVHLIFYKIKEEHKRRFHVKSSVKWLKCEQVRTCCQSKESIFIGQQKLNHILLYIHLWVDGHSLKTYEILYVISIVLSDMDLWRTAELVNRWGASRTFDMYSQLSVWISCPKTSPITFLCERSFFNAYVLIKWKATLCMIVLGGEILVFCLT
jgi:hypothetical protein